MPDDQYYLRTKEKAAPELFKIPQVRAVGLGPKFVDGRAVGKLAIRVYVESKLPLASLRAEEIIPAFIDDVPTDVLEWQEPVNIQSEITVDDCRAGVIENAVGISTGPTVTHMEITSPAHGLFNNAVIRVRGAGSITSLPYSVTVKNSDAFTIPIIENGLDVPPVRIPYAPNSARWINVSTLDNLCCCPTGTIEFVGTTDKVTIGSNGHGLRNGDRVKIGKGRLPLESQIYKVERTDKDNFILVGAKPSDFGGTPTGWSWRKVSIAPTGRITRVEMKNPVIIHSPNHGLVKNDKIVILTIQNITVEKLDNHLNEGIPPYSIAVTGPNTFTIPGVDATGWGSPDLANDFIGTWIKITEDSRKYDRTWGGIRIEVEESSTESVQASPAQAASSPLRTTINPQGGGGPTVTRRVKLSAGTLGCLAIDNISQKKVLLSNAHVIFSGSNDMEVHHPTYYESSWSCSSHRIAEKTKMVNGPDADHGFTVDAAVAKFDPDEGKYDPYIVDIGPIKGTAQINPTDILNADYRVWKRGAQTGITEGIVTDASLDFQYKNISWKNQLQIEPIAGNFRGFMAVFGDSGSVFVNKENHVVGLLFVATSVGGARANKIDEVEKALKITIWTEPALISDGGDPIDRDAQSTAAAIPDLFAATAAELSSIEGGANLSVIINSHVAEVRHLMEVNRRFAATWHRSHGPELMKRLRQAIAARTEPLPAFIQERPLRAVMTDIFEALIKYGSPELAGHVEQHRQLALQFLNLSYEELLQLLRLNPQLLPRT